MTIADFMHVTENNCEYFNKKTEFPFHFVLKKSWCIFMSLEHDISYVHITVITSYIVYKISRFKLKSHILK